MGLLAHARGSRNGFRRTSGSSTTRCPSLLTSRSNRASGRTNPGGRTLVDGPYPTCSRKGTTSATAVGADQNGPFGKGTGNWRRCPGISRGRGGRTAAPASNRRSNNRTTATTIRSKSTSHGAGNGTRTRSHAGRRTSTSRASKSRSGGNGGTQTTNRRGNRDSGMSATAWSKPNRTTASSRPGT